MAAAVVSDAAVAIAECSISALIAAVAADDELAGVVDADVGEAAFRVETAGFTC